MLRRDQKLRSESGESLPTDGTDHTATLEDGTITSLFDAEETDEIAARLYDLLEVDPQSALVQLRLELENARKANSSGVDSNDTAQFVFEATDTELVNAYDDVTSLCTSAVHSSEEIDCTDATRVIDLGLRVLDRLLSRGAVTD